MGTSTEDIFGNIAKAVPATPGSYGEAPTGYRLPAVTRLGAVHLQVGSLDRSLPFYVDTLGLNLLGRDGSRVMLGGHGAETPLVELHERPGTRPAPGRGRLGLFHFAILLPDRATLGRFVQHLADIGARAGAADHRVSEAFYLQDPDNLGIEVYVDRPRSSWQRVGKELVMATDPIDAEAIVKSAGAEGWSGMPAGTVIGHVHLHVGDLGAAGAFYSEALGLDRMVWHYPGALFLAAGGYHHHLGTNTWAGSAAAPPTGEDAQLLEWTIQLPRAADLTAVEQSFAAAGFAAEREVLPNGQPSILSRDPWGTPVRITT